MELGANVVIAGRFKLNRLLGKGGMGSVWHATHLGLEIPCAVKFIEGEFAALPEAQQRFEREAKAAAALRSPHVVQILDHGVFDNVPYIAMELLEGEDLGKRLGRVGRIHPQQLVVIIAQVCRALTKAHAGSVVHRDLKPDNIFLVRDDDREVAKVLDFGIAKANSVTGGIEGSNTKTGAMLGTPYYMSPEQAQGTKTVDYRSDLWSLAVIVFQCVTGKLPFDSEALGDLLVKIIVLPIPVPSQLTADVPPGFDQWWAKAANRDPAARFQTAKEFGESLAQVLGGAAGVMSGAVEGSGPHLTPLGFGPGATPFPGGQPLLYLQTPQPMGGPGQGPDPSGQYGNPNFHQTPQPGAQGYPQVQIAEASGMHAPVQAGTANGLTAGPMSEPITVPKSKSGSMVGLAAGVAVVCVAAGVVLAFKLSSGPASAPPVAAVNPPALVAPKAAAAPAVALEPTAPKEPAVQPGANVAPVAVAPPPPEQVEPGKPAAVVAHPAVPVQPKPPAFVAPAPQPVAVKAPPAPPQAAAGSPPPAKAPAPAAAKKPADLGF